MKSTAILAVLALSLHSFAADAGDKRVVITKENWAAEVEKSDKPVLVDFWAPWCGPCKMIDPSLREIASANASIKIAKVNVDDHGELAKRFKVSGIPCLVMMKGGKEIARVVGGMPKAKIEEFIKANAGK